MNQTDHGLAVRFYLREEENNYKSSVEGRPIYDSVDFIRIQIPGDSTTVIEAPVNEDHKGRFPLEWARYLNEKAEGGRESFSGTPLTEWTSVTRAQAMELRHYGYYTVEQVAQASDQNISRLGMMVGMAPLSFRDKARAFIAQAKDASFSQRQAEELAKRDLQISDLQAQNERMAQQMAAILSKLEEPEGRRPGRPRKETAEA